MEITRLITIAVLASAAGIAAPAVAKPLEVVASFTVLADMAREIGGDAVHVTSLVGPNGDPHAYEPTPDDARRLKEADLVVVNGLALEGWIDRLIAASGYRSTIAIASEGIKTLQMKEDGRTIIDPHAWNDAANGASYARKIAKALESADAVHAADYEARVNRYAAQLEALDAETRKAVGAIPSTQRKILTTHDAFGYFGKAYGIEFLAPLGFSTENEAAAATVAKLIGEIRTYHIETYFLENSNDPRLIQQIARATGARPGGELYAEALSPADGPAATYIAMFRHNRDLILRALASSPQRFGK